MFQDYLEKEKQQQQLEKEKKEQSNWDYYIDKQIAHLVIEYQFDFQEIANLLIGLSGHGGIKNITKERVQERWLNLHRKRKQQESQKKQGLKIKHQTQNQIQQNFQKQQQQQQQQTNQQQQQQQMTVDELIETLPQKQRKKIDFLKVTKEDKQKAQYLDKKGLKHNINDFNILEHSIKGDKDPEVREQSYRQKEKEFLQNLSKIAENPDPDMFEKPMVFRAHFQSHKDFQVEKETLTTENVKPLLAQKIRPNQIPQMDSGLNQPPEPSDSFQMDNFVSNFSTMDQFQQQQNETYNIQMQEMIQQTLPQESIQQFQQQTEYSSTTQTESEFEDLSHKKGKLQHITQQQQQQQQFQTESSRPQSDYIQSEEEFDQKIKPQKQNFMENNNNNSGGGGGSNESIKEEEKEKQQQQQLSKNIFKDQIQVLKNRDESQLQELLKEVEKETNQNQQQQQQQQNLSDESIDEDEENEQEEEDDEDYFELQRKALKQNMSVKDYKRNQKKQQKKLQQQKKQQQINDIEGQNISSNDADDSESSDNKGIYSYIENKMKQAPHSQKVQLPRQQNEQELEWERQKEEEKFAASIKFKEMLKEQERKRQEEREKDLKILEKMRQKSEQIQQQKQQKKEQKQQEKLDKQIKKQAEKQKQDLLAQKKLEQEYFEKQHQKLQAQEIEQQQEQILAYNQTLQNILQQYQISIQKISKNYTPQQQYINDTLYLKQINSIPQTILDKFIDFKQYDISRDGITSRYQTLIFPYIEENQQFTSQFLSFFLRNSFFRNLPSEQELKGEIQQEQEQNFPRLSSHGFPFCLISFFIGSYSQALQTERSDLLSTYLKNAQPLFDELQQNKLKKCLFLFFDTSLGRGNKTLSKKLDTPLEEIIDLRSLEKAQKKYPSLKLQPSSKLSDMMLDYQKQMEITDKIFASQTFHSLCPHYSLLDQNNDLIQNQLEQEQCVVIIRAYSEIQQTSSNTSSQKYDNDPSLINQTITGFQSDLQTNVEGFSQTRLSQQKPIVMHSVLHNILEKIEQKGIHLLALKQFYFTKSTLQEFNDHIESHFHLPYLTKEEQNHPVIVLAFQGHKIQHKLQKLIGNEDPKLAKKFNQNSINSLFYKSRSNSVICTQSSQQAQKMLSYFFTPKLEKIETFQQLQQLKLQENNPKKLYIIKPKPSPPIFLLNEPKIEQKILLISSYLPPKLYPKLLKLIQKRGFSLLNIRFISNHDINHFLLNNPELSEIIQQNNLQDFCFRPQNSHLSENIHSTNLVLKLQGQNFHSLKQQILQKFINYNTFIHPYKSQILQLLPTQKQQQQQDTEDYELQQEKLQDLEKLFFSSYLSPTQNIQFTKYDKFQHFIVIFPYLNFSSSKQNQKQIQHSDIDLQIFQDLNLELLGIKQTNNQKLQQSIQQPLKKLISNNLNISSKLTKRKPQFSHFCDLLSQSVTNQEFLLLFFRLQDEEYQTTQEKLKEKLLQSPTLQNSNLTFSEQQIITQGQPSYTPSSIPQEYFECLFLESDLQQMVEISINLKTKLYDNTLLDSSFIFDLPPPDQIHEPIKTILILNPYIVDQILSKPYILKKLENEEFSTILFQKQIPDPQITQIIIQNHTQNLEIHSLDLQDKSGYKQKLQHQIQQLNQKLHEQPHYILILEKPNAIFSAKKILQDFIQTSINFIEDQSAQDTPVIKDPLLFSIENAFYTCQNFQNSQKEIKIMEDNDYHSTIPYKKPQQQQNQQLQQQPKPATSLLHRLQQPQLQSQKIFILLQNNFVQDILKKLQNSKLTLQNLSIIPKFTQSNIEQISDLFHPKHDSKSLKQCLEKYNQKPEDGSFIALTMTSKSIGSLSDIFGMFKITETGSYIQLISGQLFPKKPHFLVYTQSQDQIQKLEDILI